MKKATTSTTTAVKKTTTTASTTAKTGSTTSKPVSTTTAKTTTTATKTTTSATKTGTTGTKSTLSSTKTKVDSKTTVKKAPTKAQNEEKKIEIKQEVKIEQPLQVEQKQEEQKVQKEEVVLGEVTITYNHYKNKFPIKNGQITSAVIDDEYCMSAVFLGNFKMHLFDNTKSKIEEKINSENVTTFFGLENGKSYALQIEEDDAAEKQRESKAFVAEKKEDKLRGERKEGCSCLFGNPCVDSGVCNDWKNRYEVSKNNGWKGHQ